MAHHSSLNSQQHSLLNSATGSSQRGSASSNPLYQSSLHHLSRHSPQSQLFGNYSTQKPSDQFQQNLINGSGFQSSEGSSCHPNVQGETQFNLQHSQISSPQQYGQIQHQQQSSLPQQHQHQSNPINHNHHHIQFQHSQNQKSQSSQLMQQHQHSMLPVSQTQSQPNQTSQLKSIQHQTQLTQPQRQPYVHMIQKSHEQQRQVPKCENRSQQPRRILQNPAFSQKRNIAKEVDNNQAPVPQSKESAQNIENIDTKIDTFSATVEEDSGNKILDKKEVEHKKDPETTDNVKSTSQNKELANTKEKTPMTLVQELAKFNKIDRKYTLLDEQGPAHKKTFYVKLHLGTEEYSSSGPSIRKAQQSAAAIALKETQFKHPPQKRAWKVKREPEADGKLTPTVELNGLAMKRGEAASYKAIEPQQPPYYFPPGVDARAMYNQRYYHHMRAGHDPRYARGYWPMRYHYPRLSRGFYVSLRVGHREFIGDGPTRQAARHNAAVKALKILRNLPEKDIKVVEEEAKEEETYDDADGLKSRVTSVHEIAFRRKLTVYFEVLRESGPPHMKTFTTRCTVGDLMTEGEGNSKKLSKKIASELMFEKLKELGPLPPQNTTKPRHKMLIYKKKNRIKADIQQQKADPNYGVGVNPISRLIQIMCAQKKKEPVYTLVAENGLAGRKDWGLSSRMEFIMQIEVDGKTCNGTGPNKKLAKRAAAEAMLDQLGFNKPSPQPTKSSIKQPSTEGHSNGNAEKKVTFSESCQKSPSNEVKGQSSGHQQKVPGLLHLPSKSVVSTQAQSNSSSSLPFTSVSNSKEPLINLSSILKPNWRPELQLRELCKALNYPIDINNFTKTEPNNHLNYISQISIDGNDNKQTFLGSSKTAESARDNACMEALKVLMARIKDMHPAGDGSPHIKKSLLSRTSSGQKDIS